MSSSSQMTTFIYGLLDPRNGQLRYIGKSNNPTARRYEHVCASQIAAPTHRNYWIKSLLTDGVKPEMLILEEVSTNDWKKAERWWISYWKFVGSNLVNGTSGGEGLHNPSVEVRKKIGDSCRGKKRQFTPEHIAKIAARNRERANDSEWLRNARDRLNKVRNRIGHPWSDESKVKASVAAKARMASLPKSVMMERIAKMVRARRENVFN